MLTRIACMRGWLTVGLTASVSLYRKLSIVVSACHFICTPCAGSPFVGLCPELLLPGEQSLCEFCCWRLVAAPCGFGLCAGVLLRLHHPGHQQLTQICEYFFFQTCKLLQSVCWIVLPLWIVMCSAYKLSSNACLGCVRDSASDAGFCSLEEGRCALCSGDAMTSSGGGWGRPCKLRVQLQCPNFRGWCWMRLMSDVTSCPAC